MHQAKAANRRSRERRKRSPLCPAIAFCAALQILGLCCREAQSATLTVNGVTFSDRLGGFVLEKVTGEGSIEDPFVLIERMTDADGGTLSFRVAPDFGNHIGSQHTIGFALTKVIENATDIPWSSFELELQSQLGISSDDSDGLSFGQGSNAGRLFTASGFSQVTIVDKPYDRVEFDQGRISVGERVTLRFVISDYVGYPPPTELFLPQRPSRQVAEVAPRRLGNRLAFNRLAATLAMFR